MAHSHHNHSHGSDHAAGNIALAFFLNLIFCIVEFAGGLFTNSIAILSDALHDFGDSLSLGLAWYFQKVSARKPNEKYTYGFKRFSILSALINSLILLFGSGIVLYESIRRIAHPASTNAEGMLILAIAGLLVNGLAVLRLRKGGSLNERVVSLHLLEDVLGWAAVLAGSLVMMFFDLPVLDPLLSIGISCFILYNVYHNLKKAFRIILQGKPDEVDEDAIRNDLLALRPVQAVHDLHIWSMDSEYMVVTVHLVVPEGVNEKERQSLRMAARNLLKNKGMHHSTIEIETCNEACEWCECS